MNSLAERNEHETGISDWQMMRDQAQVLLKSGFLPQSIKTPEQALTIMLTGRELGIPAMQALRGITVIQGTPAIKPELMLALAIQRVPGLVLTFGTCDNSSATVSVKTPSMPSGFTTTFTMADAKAAGLAGKQNWQNYPGNMLRWRAIGNALHIACPQVLVGLYTPDELGAITTADGDMVSMPPPAQLPPAIPVDTQPGRCSLQQSRKIHALAKQKLGPDVELFRELKTEICGDTRKTTDMTAEQASLMIDTLEALQDYIPDVVDAEIIPPAMYACAECAALIEPSVWSGRLQTAAEIVAAGEAEFGRRLCLTHLKDARTNATVPVDDPAGT